MSPLSTSDFDSRSTDVYTRKERTMPRFMRFALAVLMLCGIALAATPARSAHAAGGGERQIWLTSPPASTARAANGAARIAIAGQGFAASAVTVLFYREETDTVDFEFESTAASNSQFYLVTPLYDCTFVQAADSTRYLVYAYDVAADKLTDSLEVYACDGMFFEEPLDPATENPESTGSSNTEGSGYDLADAYEPGQGNATVSIASQTVDYGASANDNAGAQQSGPAAVRRSRSRPITSHRFRAATTTTKRRRNGSARPAPTATSRASRSLATGSPPSVWSVSASTCRGPTPWLRSTTPSSPPPATASTSGPISSIAPARPTA